MSVASDGISLPQWYGSFSFGAPGAPGSPSSAAVALGPVDVFNADAGAQRATFGNPAEPGAVVFDGYLFERADLRRELGLPPDTADAAIVAAAYQRWGLDALDRLDGSYLAAIWEPVERRFVLAHDPLGHHPVFFARSHDRLWFGSNVLALPHAGVVSQRPNRVSLALSTLLLWPAAGQTFFADVQRLRPGHYLAASAGGGLREVAYWSPWLDDEAPGLTEAEAWAQFEPTLTGAIDRAMELQPNGIMLSGGLDSVTIAALAADYAKAHGTPLVRAVSGRRDDFPGDEGPMQEAVASALGMDRLFAVESEWVGSESKVRLSLDEVSRLPGPSRIWWVGATSRFYRFASDHGVYVALTGSGGDNWVSVADPYAAHAMRTLDLAGLVRHMRSWMGTGGLTFKTAAHHLLWSGGLRILLDVWGERWLPAPKRAYHRWRSRAAQPDWLCPDPVLRAELVETLVAQRPPALTAGGRMPRDLYRHAQRSPVNPYYQYEFEVGFHVESDSGVRLLSPYHDKQLVRFLNSIPPQVLLHGSSYKGMLRPVAERRLPGLGLTQQRKVYAGEIRQAQLRELAGGVREQWPSHGLEALGALGVVAPGLAKARFAAPVAGLTHITMYALMSADRWLRVHGPS